MNPIFKTVLKKLISKGLEIGSRQTIEQKENGIFVNGKTISDAEAVNAEKLLSHFGTKHLEIVIESAEKVYILDITNKKKINL